MLRLIITSEQLQQLKQQASNYRLGGAKQRDPLDADGDECVNVLIRNGSHESCSEIRRVAPADAAPAYGPAALCNLKPIRRRTSVRVRRREAMQMVAKESRLPANYVTRRQHGWARLNTSAPTAPVTFAIRPIALLGGQVGQT